MEVWGSSVLPTYGFVLSVNNGNNMSDERLIILQVIIYNFIGETIIKFKHELKLSTN